MSSWGLNTSAPSSIDQAFNSASQEKSWGWFGLPSSGEGSLFEAQPVGWEFDFSLPQSFYMFSSDAPPIGGGGTYKFTAMMGLG